MGTMAKALAVLLEKTNAQSSQSLLQGSAKTTLCYLLALQSYYLFCSLLLMCHRFAVARLLSSLALRMHAALHRMFRLVLGLKLAPHSLQFATDNRSFTSTCFACSTLTSPCRCHLATIARISAGLIISAPPNSGIRLVPPLLLPAFPLPNCQCIQSRSLECA